MRGGWTSIRHFISHYSDGLGLSGDRVAGALVVPVLGVGWVGNGDLFLGFFVGPAGIGRLF